MRRCCYSIAVVLVVAGCQRAPEPVEYRGVVTLDGRPIESGRIQMVTPGEPPEGAEIINGKFAGKALPGERRVELYGFKTIKVADPSQVLPGMEGTRENYVPARYNDETTLTADLKSEGENAFEFKLTSTEE